MCIEDVQIFIAFFLKLHSKRTFLISEAGVAFPSGSLFASGGGVALKLWDFTMTGRALQDLSDAHSKAMSSKCF